MSSLNDLRAVVNKGLAEYSLASRAVLAERTALKKARAAEADTLTAQKVVQEVAEGVQKRAHDQIAAVVSRCLSAVFDRPYEFSITFEQKRGRTEAVLTFAREDPKLGRVEVSPVSGAGGGVLDVAAFALRLACMMLRKPRPRPVLIADEPFRFVSEHGGYRERMRDLLETLSAEMSIQIVMVTHDKTLEAGKVIRL